ncbi:hypothetical protein PYW08_000848 [Mythimna loreyi]|uniref:Uncharacterized protein n=1 Tax=Mythimna loreyi TaxID=667449 RepID=A0ACC2R0S7_9NEOP|nr:hypothetical protein PYW08_000848 [Mythimna loreyi]
MHTSAVLCCILLSVLNDVLTVETSDLYTIRTEGCSITGMSEVNESIKKIVTAPPSIHNCSSVEPLVASNASHLWVQRETFDLYNILKEDTFYCCYKFFSAPVNINNIVYSECKQFSTVIKAEHEFVNVYCYYLDNVVYNDYFLFNYHDDIRPDKSPNEESYNVIILGLESMSRLNFHRTMPLTSNFLKERGVVELLGYSKLGDNSYPNLFPALTGLSFKNIRQTCIHDTVFNLEKCPNTLLWDKFKEKGYHTALGSDSIAGLLGQYEHRLPRIPTDFYLQPFILETRKLYRNQFYDYHACMGSKYYYKVLLEYIYGLTQHLELNKLFGMFWEESISHEDLNNPHIMDESYFNFLTDLRQHNYLSKTILIFLSDHGMRWGDIMRTEQGRMEGFLPLLGILFPEEFRRQYKLAFENIQQNAHRLTTPYDIHETLLDLLDLGSLEDDMIRKRTKSSVKSKSSLFLPVSTLRNCSSAGIEEHWCPCHRGRKVKVGSKMKITCEYNDEQIYQQYYLFARKKPLEKSRRKNETSYNVIVMGIDAISRLNFHRTMPKTVAYLKQKGAIELLGIDDHWCTCHKGIKIPPKSFDARDAAEQLVKQINEYLKEYEQCAELTLAEVMDVTEMIAGEPREKEVGWREFMAVVSTTPGDGVFEGTLRQRRETWSLAGTVSRLNLYGEQSHCVNQYQAKLYCYCR